MLTFAGCAGYRPIAADGAGKVSLLVIPAQAGIQCLPQVREGVDPACAGMTSEWFYLPIGPKLREDGRVL
jgi:hypothetical protein